MEDREHFFALFWPGITPPFNTCEGRWYIRITVGWWPLPVISIVVMARLTLTGASVAFSQKIRTYPGVNFIFKAIHVVVS